MKQEVKIENLQVAFEKMLARYLQRNPRDEAAVREAWPLQNLIQEQAEAWFNGKVFTITTRSGFGSWGHPDPFEIDLPPDAIDQSVGEALNESLARSRELSLRDLEADFPPDYQAWYKTWLTRFMERHGVKTKRTLFFTMLHITIRRRAGELVLRPSNHDRLDGWSGDGVEGLEVKLPANSSTQEIGAAVRLCFSRCLDTYKK